MAVTLLVAVSSISAFAQPEMSRKERKQQKKLERSVSAFFSDISDVNGVQISYDSCRFNADSQTLYIYGDSVFARQHFTDEIVKEMHNLLKTKLKKRFRNYSIILFAQGTPIQRTIQPQRQEHQNEKSLEQDKNTLCRQQSNKECYWGNIDYLGRPWVYNASELSHPALGLQDRHISLWASHGIYFNNTKNKWEWQRPSMNLTREDLFTQTLVVPMLMPMLADAGAVVFSPRERDWQRNEIIIDNDSTFGSSKYSELGVWKSTGLSGFAPRHTFYVDEENPFTDGTGRQTEASCGSVTASITYTPDIPIAGRYAVYVSYHSLGNSIDDAHYIVRHKGQQTEFRVNQRMGSHTWVYLGTFDFDKGASEDNCVVLTNESSSNGIVTADAVRIGGGMGNISRGGHTSGFPRCFEGARYYAQYAGMPYDVYGGYLGKEDYKDDINTRSLMINHMAGGSVFVPSNYGLNVPIELSVAIHTDAGYHKNGKDIWGTLGICTTMKENADTFRTGLSRHISTEFATSLRDNLFDDISESFGIWEKREIWNRNYSESRIPEVPSAIIETLSHESFPDMQMAWDPNFRFVLARSIYKTILKTITKAHGEKYVVSPLPPHAFRIEFMSKNEARLMWKATADRLESSSKPTAYIIYTKTGNKDFDNGIMVNEDSHIIKLQPNVLYQFKVIAVNAGGKSFPSETLSAYYHPESKKNILIVNGFHRLSSPATKQVGEKMSFALDEDPGMWHGKNPSFVKYLGQFLMGNDDNNTTSHVRAILANEKYNICSCSSDAVTNGEIDLRDYDMVDIILGNECDDGRSLVPYKALTKEMQDAIRRYLHKGKALFISGSYLSSDMKEHTDSIFLSKHLHIIADGKRKNIDDNRIIGMGDVFTFYNALNEEHYAATTTDALKPVGKAISALFYPDFTTAGIAFRNRQHSMFAIGLPFECISTEAMRSALMGKVLTYFFN